MLRNLPIAPEQASNFALQSDALFFTLLALTLVFTFLVGVGIAYFSIKYRRGNRVDRSRPVHHSTVLELSWSIGPLILGLAVFIWAAKLFATMMGPAPKDAMEIYVVGKQWMWHMQHPNGIRENNELHIPLGKPIKLTMISQDVIHDLYIPAFRVKRDVIPGVYTSFWFTPTQTGKYHLFCAQYCGSDHSVMTGFVHVMEPTDFQKWLASGGQRTADTQPLPKTMAAAGQAIYEQQGCGNCHDADGMSNGISRGPLLTGIYGAARKLKDGRVVPADDSYLRHSILESSEEIVESYQQIMPAYKGQITEEQVMELIAYIKSLGGPAAQPLPPGGTVPANPASPPGPAGRSASGGTGAAGTSSRSTAPLVTTNTNSTNAANGR